MTTPFATMRSCAFYLSAVAFTVTSLHAQTLPDKARQQGAVAGSILGFDGPIASEPQLMAAADLVVHGRVADVQTRLSTDLGVYTFTDGEFGAYRIRDELVTSMTRRVAARRHDKPLSPVAFFQTLRRLQ
jgi:uncharacterized protein YdbL (DUF1318 family)